MNGINHMQVTKGGMICCLRSRIRGLGTNQPPSKINNLESQRQGKIVCGNTENYPEYGMNMGWC